MNYHLRKLRVKIKSLAEESRIIRQEIDKVPRRHDDEGNLNWEDASSISALATHRTVNVRRESRDALLAYGFLRGKKYHEIEHKYYEEPNWVNIERIVKSFSGFGFPLPRAFNDFYCEGKTCKAIRRDESAV